MLKVCDLGLYLFRENRLNDTTGQLVNSTMASFGGHALPGALLVILSLLLTVEGVLVYFTRRAQFRCASCVIVALGT